MQICLWLWMSIALTCELFFVSVYSGMHKCTGSWMPLCVCICMYLSGCIVLVVCPGTCMFSWLACECAYTHILSCLFVVCMLVYILVLKICLHVSMCMLVSAFECSWSCIVGLHCVLPFLYKFMHMNVHERCVYTHVCSYVPLCVRSTFLYAFMIWVYCRSEHLFLYIVICILVSLCMTVCMCAVA